MEDTLGDVCYARCTSDYQVLILVLMEDTLGGIIIKHSERRGSLNPCFNGRYSRRKITFPVWNIEMSLNPCFNGRYSRRASNKVQGNFILSLNPCFNGRYSRRAKTYISLFIAV